MTINGSAGVWGMLTLLLALFAQAASVELITQTQSCAVKIYGDVLAVLVEGPITPSQEFENVTTGALTALLSTTPRSNPVIGQVPSGEAVKILEVLYSDYRSERVDKMVTCQLYTPRITTEPQIYVIRRTETPMTSAAPTQSPNTLVAVIGAMIIIIAGVIAALLILRRK